VAALKEERTFGDAPPFSVSVPRTRTEAAWMENETRRVDA
jgi:hypothetical protein